MKVQVQRSVTVKTALSQTGGLLRSFSHSLNPYTGCAFGHGCGVYCYVPFLPVHQHRSEGHGWGDYLWAKENVADLLRGELKRHQQRSRMHRLRIFMSTSRPKPDWN